VPRYLPYRQGITDQTRWESRNQSEATANHHHKADLQAVEIAYRAEKQWHYERGAEQSDAYHEAENTSDGIV